MIGNDIITGCIDTLEFNTVIEPCGDSYLPNIFSPNFDGVDDHFMPYLSDCAVEISTFQIYDRWGNLIYLKEKARVGEVKWNGFYGTKLASAGVYVYFIRALQIDGSTITYNGSITLLK